MVGETLGEVLQGFGAIEGAIITPHDPPKYFRYHDEKSPVPEGYVLVDIHVTRSGQEICPKQNLLFKMQSGDIVEILALIC